MLKNLSQGAEGGCKTQIITNFLNPHPNSSIPISVNFRSPYQLKRRTNTFSRGDDTRSKIRAVPTVNRCSLSILFLTLGDSYYPGQHGLCHRCKPMLYFSFPKFLRLHREGQRDLIEYVEISCEGIGVTSLVSAY
jgi:hypothetical protein